MWAVYYASAGCLPESHPAVFSELEDAALYVYNEWTAQFEQAYTEDTAPFEMLELYRRGEYDHVTDHMGDSDPTPGSLYAWTIEEVEEPNGTD